MRARRRTKGDETWNRLLNWTHAQKVSERLTAHILIQEGFTSVDPSHPLGGPDGLRDLICVKDGISWVVAAYFPNGEHSFSKIRSKFESDVRGAACNNAQGFVFVVNQYLTISKRKELIRIAPVEQAEIYHLERIARILDAPTSYGIRLEFLDIEMTKEEQLAFFATVTRRIDEQVNEWQKFRDELREDVKQLIQEALSQRNYPDPSRQCHSEERSDEESRPHRLLH